MSDWLRDDFNDLRKPYMARGNFMLGAMAVVIDPRIEPLHVGDYIAPIWPHPFWFWVRRLFRMSPPQPMCFRSDGKIEEHQVFQAANKLFMSPAAWEAVKQRTREGSPT